MQTHNVFLLLSTLTSVYSTAVHLLEPIIENVVHLQTSLPPPDAPGIWKTKKIWKARWVQEYKHTKTWRPVWRKVWSPVEIREWVPIPRPPPNIHESEPGHSEPHPPSSGEFIHPPIAPPTPPGPQSPPRPPAFKPIGPTSGPEPPNSYGPPSAQNLGPSTALHPVPDGPPPEWPTPDMQELLTSYHTIREPEQQSPSANYQTNSPNPERPLTNYHASSPNPERQRVNQFLEAPKTSPPPLSEQFYNPRANASAAQHNASLRNAVSPYAAKLADAVLREKFNQSLNPTERPSGLTDVVFKPGQSSTTAKSPPRVSKAAGGSSTENPSNVYIVTPVSFA